MSMKNIRTPRLQSECEFVMGHQQAFHHRNGWALDEVVIIALCSAVCGGFLALVLFS